MIQALKGFFSKLGREAPLLEALRDEARVSLSLSLSPSLAGEREREREGVAKTRERKQDTRASLLIFLSRTLGSLARFRARVQKGTRYTPRRRGCSRDDDFLHLLGGDAREVLRELDRDDRPRGKINK